MINISKTFRIIILFNSLAFLFSCTVANAQDGALDGKAFIGQYREKHRRNEKKDELRFVAGEFFSIGYEKEGFKKGAYSVREEDNETFFEAETVNPEQGKITWNGVVQGDSIKVDYRWTKKGWLSNTEKEYQFNGKLKK